MTKFADRVKDTTTTTGTGIITLANSPPARFRTFGAAFATGVNLIAYTIEGQSGSEFESGTGTYVSATTFSRDKVETSSNGNALVNFSAGTKDIYCAATAKGVINAGGGSLQVVATSSLCVSDADLSIGSTTFGTDQVTQLQSILDLAAAGPLLVIWDGAYSVGPTSTTTSLRIRSNTTIRALPGCGAIMRNTANVPMFRNYNPNVATITDKNIRIEGGIWNGNAANNINRTDANGYIFMHDFIGVDGLALTGGAEIRKCKAYAWHGANVTNVLIHDVTIDQGVGSLVNSDGIHFNGPASNITVRSVRLYNCFDDSLAFNADDNWATAGVVYGPYQPSGDITNVHVEDVVVNAALYAIRVLSGGSRIDKMTIKNVRGRTNGYWLTISNFIPADIVVTGPGNIGAITIDDCNVDTEFYSAVYPAQAQFGCKIEQLNILNCTRSKFGSTTHPSFSFDGSSDIGQLNINNCKSYPYAGATTNLTGVISFESGSKVRTARISNCTFEAPAVVSGYPIEIKAGALITQLLLVGNQGTNYTGFVNNAGSVGSLQVPATVNFMNTAASTWSLTAGYAEVSASSLTYGGTATTIQSAKKTTLDAFSGNIKLASRISFTGTYASAMFTALVVRGSGTQPWSGGSNSSYYISLNADPVAGGVALAKSVAGVETVIGTKVGILAFTLYDVTVTAKANVISASVQRVSDGFYMNSAGTFAGTVANVFSVTDNSIAAASGEYGVYVYTNGQTGEGVTFSNFAAIAAP